MVSVYKPKGGVEPAAAASNASPSYSIHITPRVSSERYEEVLGVLKRLDNKGIVEQLFKSQAPWSDEPQRAFLNATIPNQNYSDPPTMIYLPSVLTRRLDGATAKNCLEPRFGSTQDLPDSIFSEPNNEFYRLFGCYMEQTFSNFIDVSF